MKVDEQLFLEFPLYNTSFYLSEFAVFTIERSHWIPSVLFHKLCPRGTIKLPAFYFYYRNDKKDDSLVSNKVSISSSCLVI